LKNFKILIFKQISIYCGRSWKTNPCNPFNCFNLDFKIYFCSTFYLIAFCGRRRWRLLGRYIF
jgi:hypothetical protein